MGRRLSACVATLELREKILSAESSIGEVAWWSASKHSSFSAGRRDKVSEKNLSVWVPGWCPVNLPTTEIRRPLANLTETSPIGKTPFSDQPPRCQKGQSLLIWAYLRSGIEFASGFWTLPLMCFFITHLLKRSICWVLLVPLLDDLNIFDLIFSISTA